MVHGIYSKTIRIGWPSQHTKPVISHSEILFWNNRAWKHHHQKQWKDSIKHTSSGTDLSITSPQSHTANLSKDGPVKISQIKGLFNHRSQTVEKKTFKKRSNALSSTASPPPFIPMYIYKKLEHLSVNEPREFCGESLYYIVEYYCVHVKGTSVYTPENHLETVVVGNSGTRKREARLPAHEQIGISSQNNFFWFSFFLL